MHAERRRQALARSEQVLESALQVLELSDSMSRRKAEQLDFAQLATGVRKMEHQIGLEPTEQTASASELTASDLLERARQELAKRGLGDPPWNLDGRIIQRKGTIDAHAAKQLVQ